MRRRLHVDSTVPPGHQHSSPQASQQSSQGPGASTSARMHQGDVNPPAHTHEHDTTSSTGEFSVKDVNRMLMEFLMYLGRIVLVCYPIYLMGWLGLSISWILLALLLFIMWKNNRKWKDVRMDTAVNFLENERRVIDKEYETILPAWVRRRCWPTFVFPLNFLQRPYQVFTGPSAWWKCVDITSLH